VIRRRRPRDGLRFGEGSMEACTAPRRGSGWRRYRVVLYLLLGLAATDVAVARFRRTWTAYDPNEYQARAASCRRQAWDLILIGGSPTSEGIDPAHLAGLAWHGTPLGRVFNLGLPGGTTTTTWHAVEHAITTPPRLLVYGITATDLNDNRDELNGVWTLMDLADVADWAQHRPGRAEWCVRHFAGERLTRLWGLYYYRNGIRLAAADLVETWRPGICPDAAAEARRGRDFAVALRRGDGFAPRWVDQTLAGIKAQGGTQPYLQFLERYRLGGHLQYLHRILDWAEERGVTMVLIDMPVADDLEAAYAPAFAAYREALAQVERDRGITVLRATAERLGLDDTGFADRIHLNAHGRELMGRWLCEQLAR
jgi:hypothetical protein